MDIEVEYPSILIAILRPAGRMDVETSPLVRQAILDLAEQGKNGVVVDLAQVDFMDSSGLSALVSGMKALRRVEGRLALANARPQVRTAMRLTMLDRVFPIANSVEQAVEILAKPI